MVRPEGESHPASENDSILRIDPAELMRDNPAALIVNEEAYARMKGGFTYGPKGQFEPPHVVRVKTYSAQHGIVTKLFVIDGLTRTKFVYDNKDNPEIISPDFQFEVKDVTESVLKNPTIVHLDEREDDQKALRLSQYFRAVVPPTVVHAEIAPRRIAAYLVNGWEQMVGEEIAERFPAVAALSYVSNERTKLATDNEFEKTLTGQAAFITNETSEERQRLHDSLRNIASVIREAKLLPRRQEVAQEAYMFIGSGSSVIGGEIEATKESYAWVRTPAVEKKLARTYQEKKGELESARLALGQSLKGALTRLSGRTIQEGIERRNLADALDDDTLTLSQTHEVIASDSPSIRYKEIKRDINRASLRTGYVQSVRRQTLTPTEQIFIDNMGGSDRFNDFDIPSQVSAIQYSAAVLRQAGEWHDQLRGELESFVQRGVSREILERILSDISQKQGALLVADSAQIISNRTRDLQRAVSESSNTITQQILKQDLIKKASDLYKDEPVGAHTPLIQERLAWALIQDHAIDATDATQSTRWISEFRNLDIDLQQEVLSGTLRLTVAVSRQASRRRTPPSTLRVQIETQAPIKPSAPTEPEGQKQPIAQDTESVRRIEVNNRRLQEGIDTYLTPFVEVVSSVDLESDEVQKEIKQKLGVAEQLMEKLRSGHPDVVRLIDETLPSLQLQLRRLREERLARETEEAERDTRTGR